MHLVNFPPFLSKCRPILLIMEATFEYSCLLSCWKKKNTSEEVYTVKANNLFSNGINTLFFKKTAFQKGSKIVLTELPALEVYQFPLEFYTLLLFYNTVKPRWLEYRWIVYLGWFKLVFESLRNSSKSSRKQIFREIFLLYREIVCVCVCTH